MNLQYQGETIWVPETKLGTYIGSGDGTVAGEALSGNVKWSLFENQAPDVCDFTLVGTIAEAGGSDGAQMQNPTGTGQNMHSRYWAIPSMSRTPAHGACRPAYVSLAQRRARRSP